MTPSNIRTPETRIWEIRPVSEQHVAELAQAFGLSPLVARILAGRNLADAEALRAFLDPRLDSLLDPFLMADMTAAVERIVRAIDTGERIAVYGDYDADGLTATALLVRFFNWIGIEVEAYIPHRLQEGYGMSASGIDNLAARHVQLIVTVDNGIGCAAEVRHATTLGIDVVVTDHHQPGEHLPPAVAVVDPQRADCPYPFKELAGVGVAFKLAHALARQLGCDPAEARAFLKAQLDLVALGTVADVMPLLGENRVLTLYGLQILQNTDKVGLEAMIEMVGVDGRRLTGENIAFLFGPRLNAAGRTGNAEYALELLLTPSKNRARELAEHLDQLNVNRRALENDVLKEALEQIEQDETLLAGPILLVGGLEWHQGIIGIVASRLLDRFNRPSIVLSIEDGMARGSARSPEAFDIHSALGACADLLESFGGHRLAAGLSLEAPRMAELRQRLNEYAAAILTPEQLLPRIDVHAQAALNELTLNSVEQLDRLRPFGNGNPAPMLAFTQCRLAEPAFEVGGRHLKMRLAQQNAAPITALWFGYPEPRAELRQRLERAEAFDVAGAPMINEWNGRKSVEINIKDIRFSEA